MLRALLGVLVLANALYFGWAQGWFAPTWPAPGTSVREPARLAAQVAPERVVVLSPAAASAALLSAQPKPACVPPAAADAANGADAAQAVASAPLAAASQAEGLKPCEPGP